MHAPSIDPIAYAFRRTVLTPQRGGRRVRVFTPEKDAQMRAEYAEYRSRRRLKDLADLLGVGINALYSRAFKLGLTESRPVWA